MSGFSIARRTSLFLASLLAVMLLFCGVAANAQTANASLSGTITDPTGARIRGAKITIANQANTKDKRSTTANSAGDFDFAGLSAGDVHPDGKRAELPERARHRYRSAPGRQQYLAHRQVEGGSEDLTVDVSAQDEILTSDGVTALISADQIQELATEGRDVTELVKILPGFNLVPATSVSGQGLDNAAPDTQTVTPGGALGNYAANGSPVNGVNLISDGADVQDPGTSGASTQNINMDMVQEVKISTSNFGADTAKGPVVINAVGKSGGQAYHGSVYVIGRTYQMNSQDWLFKNQNEPKPNDRYIYPGFNIGGPVKIPFTNFNKNKKLTFIIGGEDYIQRNTFIGGTAATALHRVPVPTDCMRGQATDNFCRCTLRQSRIRGLQQQFCRQLLQYQLHNACRNDQCKWEEQWRWCLQHVESRRLPLLLHQLLPAAGRLRPQWGYHHERSFSCERYRSGVCGVSGSRLSASESSCTADLWTRWDRSSSVRRCGPPGCLSEQQRSLPGARSHRFQRLAEQQVLCGLQHGAGL